MIDLLPNYIHRSWKPFLTDERLVELKSIRNKIGNNFTPTAHNVLRFLSTNLNSIKVCILGLDPYPEKGRATGRAFEVGGLKSWQEPFRQASLRNIVRLLYKNYMGITEYKDIPAFSEIRKEILAGKFPIAPPDELFDKWESRGVLLLNVYLTTEIGVNTANSHRDIWEGFSADLIRFITKENKKISWFLWGSEAQKYSCLIPDGCAYMCRHPSRVSESYDDDFLKSDCFKKYIELFI